MTSSDDSDKTLELAGLHLRLKHFQLALVVAVFAAITAGSGAVYQWVQRPLEERVLQAQLAEMKTQLAELRRQRTEVRDELTNQDRTLRDVGKHLDEVRQTRATEMREKQRQIAELNRKQQRLMAEKTELEAEIEGLQATLRSPSFNLPKAISKLREEHGKAHRRADAAERSFVRLWHVRAPGYQVEPAGDKPGSDPKTSMANYRVSIAGMLYSKGDQYEGCKIEDIQLHGLTLSTGSFDFVWSTP